MVNSLLHIGTCSWKYDSWEGIIYPADSAYNPLQEYAKHYNTVEVDQWFWSLHGENKLTLPRERDALLYANSVPDQFRFSIKVPNSITLTHYYQKKKADPLIANPHFLSNDLFNQFINSIVALKEKLGPLMFQFEYLNKQKMPTQEEFSRRLTEFAEKLPAGLDYALEIRNPNYLNDNFFELLSGLKLIPVFLQGYYMPPVFPFIKKYQRLFSTIVIRLHGPDRSGIEERTAGIWNRIVDNRDDELDELVQIVSMLLAKETSVYINVNNHFEGSAPLTISRILQKLGTI